MKVKYFKSNKEIVPGEEEKYKERAYKQTKKRGVI